MHDGGYAVHRPQPPPAMPVETSLAGGRGTWAGGRSCLGL